MNLKHAFVMLSVMSLLLFFSASCLAQENTAVLELGQNQPTSIGAVSINGAASPSCGDFDMSYCKEAAPYAVGDGPLLFNWGDGFASCSGFPGEHKYEDLGNYPITVSFRDTCGNVTENLTYYNVEAVTHMGYGGQREGSLNMRLIAFLMGLFIVIIILAIIGMIFWIFMIVDAARRDFADKDTRVIWILVLVFLGIIGAFIYLFAVKMRADKGEKLKQSSPKKRAKRR